VRADLIADRSFSPASTPRGAHKSEPINARQPALERPTTSPRRLRGPNRPSMNWDNSNARCNAPPLRAATAIACPRDADSRANRPCATQHRDPSPHVNQVVRATNTADAPPRLGAAAPPAPPLGPETLVLACHSPTIASRRPGHICG
jgi:hypothetical protein